MSVKEEVASSCMDDGSDERTVDIETFNRDFEITGMISI